MKGESEGKDERIAGLCLRKGKNKRMEKNIVWCFKDRKYCFKQTERAVNKAEQTDVGK